MPLPAYIGDCIEYHAAFELVICATMLSSEVEEGWRIQLPPPIVEIRTKCGMYVERVEGDVFSAHPTPAGWPATIHLRCPQLARDLDAVKAMTA